jgi:alpha-ketoglutaric semialdehyde dehydrogenase
MALTGHLYIGQARELGTLGEFRAINPATGAVLEPAFGTADPNAISRACEAAHLAFDSYRETAPERRAAFLDTIAEQIMDCGDALVSRAMEESGLTRGRLEGERARTVGQLKLFASVVREGSFVEARIDTAIPERRPLPRSDLRMRHIALGPVAVFGASNFPLAFSVAGGDTAAALAAGCPVVVKAHPAHPGTSELVGGAVQRAVAKCGLHAGVFSMLFGPGNEVGAALVADPRIKAGGFTGSRAGGLALMVIAAQRREPIPLYAEMSSTNPVFALPAALAERGAAIGREFVASLTLGAGQFCTNPGLLIAVDAPGLQALIDAANGAIAAAESATMLTPAIQSAYAAGLERMRARSDIHTLSEGRLPNGINQGRATLFATDAAALLADTSLEEEIFGAASLVIRCRDSAQLRAVAERIQGQLTATVQLSPADVPFARELMLILERKAGRILINGFPTGVEVCHSMVHGGPYPATSDSRSTSVGTLAIRRFLRPVCYQDFPSELLPLELAGENPRKIWRLLNGELGKH